MMHFTVVRIAIHQVERHIVSLGMIAVSDLNQQDIRGAKVSLLVTLL
jgi:hypothetical protein